MRHAADPPLARRVYMGGGRVADPKLLPGALCAESRDAEEWDNRYRGVALYRLFALMSGRIKESTTAGFQKPSTGSGAGCGVHLDNGSTMVVCSWCPFHQNARRRIRTRSISCQPCTMYSTNDGVAARWVVSGCSPLRAACSLARLPRHCRHGITT